MIDDFGMGHTSLLYLQTGFFAVVKLDGSLTRNVLENETNAEIIGSITKLGESIHFTTIAEWVESKEQLEKLKALITAGQSGMKLWLNGLYHTEIHNCPLHLRQI